jgi:hypothetical protein
MVDIGGINWWAVLTAAVAGYVLGALWYAPPALGKRWLAALGKKKKDMQGAVLPMVAQFFLTLVIGAVLAVVIVRFGAVTWIEGGAIGLALALALALVATSMASDWMFCGFDRTLFWIQCGYKVCCITLMAAILGAWR